MIENRKSIEVQELIEDNESLLFIDCRKESELKETGTPQKAIHIELSDNFAQDVEKIITNKDQTICVICKGGLRSLKACHLLEKNGFTDLINIEDGFVDGWLPNNLPVK